MYPKRRDNKFSLINKNDKNANTYWKTVLKIRLFCIIKFRDEVYFRFILSREKQTFFPKVLHFA